MSFPISTTIKYSSVAAELVPIQRMHSVTFYGLLIVGMKCGFILKKYFLDIVTKFLVDMLDFRNFCEFRVRIIVKYMEKTCLETRKLGCVLKSNAYYIKKMTVVQIYFALSCIWY